MELEPRTEVPVHATGTVGFVSLASIVADATFRLREEGDISALASSIGRLRTSMKAGPAQAKASARLFSSCSGVSARNARRPKAEATLAISSDVKSTERYRLSEWIFWSVLIQPNEPLLKWIRTAGTAQRTSVSSSPQDMPRLPSPKSPTGRASGRASQAPSTPGMAYPRPPYARGMMKRERLWLSLR